MRLTLVAERRAGRCVSRYYETGALGREILRVAASIRMGAGLRP